MIDELQLPDDAAEFERDDKAEQERRKRIVELREQIRRKLEQVEPNLNNE